MGKKKDKETAKKDTPKEPMSKMARPKPTWDVLELYDSSLLECGDMVLTRVRKTKDPDHGWGRPKEHDVAYTVRSIEKHMLNPEITPQRFFGESRVNTANVEYFDGSVGTRVFPIGLGAPSIFILRHTPPLE